MYMSLQYDTNMYIYFDYADVYRYIHIHLCIYIRTNIYKYVCHRVQMSEAIAAAERHPPPPSSHKRTRHEPTQRPQNSHQRDFDEDEEGVEGVDSAAALDKSSSLGEGGEGGGQAWDEALLHGEGGGSRDRGRGRDRDRDWDKGGGLSLSMSSSQIDSGALERSEGYIHTCMYVCLHMCVFVCACIHVCSYVCICLYVYTCVCISANLTAERGTGVRGMYICVCIHIYLHVCVCVNIHVCIYICICVYVYIRVRIPANSTTAH